MSTSTDLDPAEDMGRKADWFFGLRGTTDQHELDAKRDAALRQVTRIRESTLARLDPGRGAIDEPAVLVGARRRANVRATDWPGDGTVDADTFFTSPVEITSTNDDLALTLKQKPRRGARSRLDPTSVRMFRFDTERRQWRLVDSSGYNAEHGYAWGRVDRPGVYAAAALPKDGAALEQVGLAWFARRMIRDGVRSGRLARAEDFADGARFRDYVVDAYGLDVGSRAGKAALADLQKAQKRVLRLPKQDWLTEPVGGRPAWELLDDAASGPQVTGLVMKDRIDEVFPWWPLIRTLPNRVGPWFSTGPYNVNGRVKSLAIDPSDATNLYAGAANGGVWRTGNGGVSWEACWTFQDTMAATAIAVAPSAPATVYAATGEDTPGYGPGYGGVGLLRSTDRGHTWSPRADAAAVGDRCNKVVVDPGNANRLFVASNTGIHRSTDGAAGFTSVLAGHATDVVMAHDHPDTLYAGLWNDGVYKTTDGGAHWTRMQGQIIALHLLFVDVTGPFPTGNDAGWIKLAIGRAGPSGSGFVVAKLGDKSGRTLSTTDGGATWQPMIGSEAVDYDEWTSFVAIHPRNPSTVYLGGLGLQRTTNGSTFTSSPGSHSDHHAMVFDPTNDAIAYVCCDGGVYRTVDNGASWHLWSHFLQATQIMSLGVSQVGGLVVGGATQDQGIIQTSGSVEWSDFGGGNEWGMFVVDPNDSRNIFVSPGGGQLRRSTDSGHTWTNPTGGLSDWWAAQNRSTVAASFAHVAVRPGDSSRVIGAATVRDTVKDAAGNVTATYADQNRLYLSTNGGVDWSSTITLASRPVRVAFAPSNGNRAYAATDNGRVWTSTTGGSGGWVETSTAANRPPAGKITSLTVDRDSPDWVYLTYGDVNPHLYRSTDSGQHWTAINGTVATMRLPDIALLDLEIDPDDYRVLWAASDIGVFRSNDAGSTWYWANDSFGANDLPRVTVTGLGIHPGTGRLYASTMGRGCYYTQSTGIISLRATAVQVAHHHPSSGIVSLRLTDGSTTYTMSRLEVIRRIQAGTEVYVIGADGSRAAVLARQPDREHPAEYLTTVADWNPADNLLNLPEFFG